MKSYVKPQVVGSSNVHPCLVSQDRFFIIMHVGGAVVKAILRL